MFFGNDISALQSPWLTWLLFALLLSVGISYYRQPAWLSSVTQVIGGKIGRSYSDTHLDYVTMLLLIFFVIGTFSLTLLMIFASTPVQLTQYGVIAGITALFLGLKALCLAWIEWTFRFSKRLAVSYTQYIQIYLLLSLVLYPWVLVCSHYGFNSWMQIALWVPAGAFVLLWLVKGYTLVSKPLSLIYVTIFIVAGELVPLCALSLVARHILYSPL